MLSFPYQDEPLSGPPPPSLPSGSTVRWRPLLPVRVFGPGGRSRLFARAVFDPCADDTVLSLGLATALGIPLRPTTGHVVRWRGQAHLLRFGDVDLELCDDAGATWRWPAVVGFSPAPTPHPILGNCGCLQFFDPTFRGEDRMVEIETNRSYPGTKG
jgi:hypothetical protein